MKAGTPSKVKSGKTTGQGFRGRWTAPTHRTKAPKSRPKAANGLSHKVILDKPFRKTWHKDREWKLYRKIYNLNVWLQAHK